MPHSVNRHFEWTKITTQNDCIDAMHEETFAIVLENFAHCVSHRDLFCCATSWIVCGMGIIVVVSSSNDIRCHEKWHQQQRKPFGQRGKLIAFIDQKQHKIKHKQTNKQTKRNTNCQLKMQCEMFEICTIMFWRACLVRVNF